MKKLLVLSIALLVLIAITSKAQSGFYDIGTIQVIEVTFPFQDWDNRMDTAVAGADGYTLASTVKINGTVFDSVGVRFKGNSSYRSTNAKNPLHIELDYVKNQAYQGYSDIKLSNGYQDPSLIREALAYEILDKYMIAPKANFARVYINGSYYGLFTSDESISKKFADKYFNSSALPIVKGTPPAGAGPGSTALPTLVYHGTDSSSTLYTAAYDLKSSYGWGDLIRLTDTLNNKPAAISSILDVDKALWMHVFNNLLINLDSYLGTFAQNYYLLEDRNGRFNAIVWDLNMAFGSFTMAASGGLNTSQMQQLIPTDGSTNASRPLISKLLAIPEYKRRFLAHYRTMLKNEFTSGSYLTRANALMSLIDSSVQADNGKFYTYTNFHNSLTSTVAGSGPGPGGQGVVGISQLMSARISYLQGLSMLTASAPVITNSVLEPAAPVRGQSVTIKASVSNGTTLTLGYRFNLLDKFSYKTMYDDGAHNDGAASDGVFGTQLQVNGGQIQYYFYAENANAGTFLPEKAEFEFFTVAATSNGAVPGSIAINEFLAANNTDTTTQAGKHEDWIELYNNTDSLLSLSGLYISDDSAVLNKWAFPAGSTIAPHGYQFLWADGGSTSDTVGLHAAFKLSATGEMIYLSNSTGTVLDYVLFGAQTADKSEGRCPNGTGAFAATSANTPGRNNSCLLGINSLSAQSAVLNLYPNPASGTVSVSAGGKAAKAVLFNGIGQAVVILSIPVAGTSFSVAGLPAGIYTLQAYGFKPVRLVVE